MKKMHLDATGTLLVLLRQTLLLAILFLNLGTANGNNAGVTGLPATTMLDAPEGTSLTAGDIAVIGWNFNTKKVRFVNLVDIPSGTIIKITDRGWLNGGFHFLTGNPGDGTLVWTVGSDISKGNVFEITFNGNNNETNLGVSIPVDGSNNIVEFNTPRSNHSLTLVNITTNTILTSDIRLEIGFIAANSMLIIGDGLFFYQGEATNPYFIFGFNNSAGTNIYATNWNTATSFIWLRDSQLPNGTGSQNALTNGENAIGLPGGVNQKDVVEYTGPVTEWRRHQRLPDHRRYPGFP